MSDASSERRELARLLSELSVRRGEFTLASGRRSSLYVDARRTTMSGAGQRLIGRMGLRTLRERGWEAEAVGGLTLGADPVAYAIANAAALEGARLDGFTVRKQPKGHGAGRQIEGPLEPGQRVVVVEDVVTTGGSALRAIGVLREFGAQVIGVLAVVDREEGGRQRIQEESGYDLAALFGVTELPGVEVASDGPASSSG